MTMWEVFDKLGPVEWAAIGAIVTMFGMVAFSYIVEFLNDRPPRD